MKKLKKNLFLLTGLFLLLGAGGCSSESDGPDNPNEPDIVQDYHFDLWVALDRHGGMGRDVQTLVRSLDILLPGARLGRQICEI